MKCKKTPTNKRRDEGMALIFVIIAGMTILAACAVVTVMMLTSKQRTDFSYQQAQLDEAAKAGLEAGMERFWNGFFQQLGPDDEPSVQNYWDYLDTILPNNPNGNADPVTVPGLAYPMHLTTGNAAVETITVDRVDDATGSVLTFQSHAGSNGIQRSVSRSIRVGGTLFRGFEFAILANNINCILCHADFKNALAEWNNDPATRPTGDSNGNGIPDWQDNLNTYDRIKVASLESLLVRLNGSGADSNIAGSVFTGGSLYDQNGNELAGLASTTFKGQEFSHGHADDTMNGLLTQDASGNMSQINLEIAQIIDDELDQWANLYMEDQIDGLVPETFPAPYQDDGGGGSAPDASEVGNRFVDDTEFDRIKNDANGTISGGMLYGVPEGGSYGGATLPTNGNMSDISGSYDGNLILVGTEDNPIILDGDVAIDGDLVLKGVVQGYGMLKSRKNVYVMGDVTYNDNATLGPDGKPFGVHYGDSGVQTENLLGVVSGGSILMGDYLTVRGKNKQSNTSKYPDKSYSIRSRDEYKTGTWSGETMYYGYFDPGVVDAGEYQTEMMMSDGSMAPRDGQQFSFTTSELMLFNELELDKTLEKRMAGDDYTARLYGLRESQPGNLYIYDYGDEHAVRYDEGGNGNRVKNLQDWVADLTPGNSDYSDAEITMLQTIIDEAAVHYMSPDANWISEDTLRQGWYDDEMSRSSEKPFEFEGLLYSNNAIFSITKSNGRHGSKTYGKMTLRGGIVAPDLGMLVPGGLELLYDERVRDLYNLEDTADVQLTQGVFRYVTPLAVAQAE
jgi:hypothetical protein